MLDRNIVNPAVALMVVLLTSLAQGEEAMKAFPESEGSDWRIVEDGLHRHTPDALRIPVVVLGDQHAMGAERAYLLVRASYEQVRPVVSEALAGKVTLVETPLPLLTLDEPWRRVMLSRHPQWRDILAHSGSELDLDAAVREGALMPEERDWRRNQALARLDISPKRLLSLPRMKSLYSRAESSREWVQGWRKQYHVKQTVTVFDAEPLLGSPATVIDIHCRQSFPNPAHRKILVADGVPTTLSQSLVPAELFQAVMSALEEHLPDSDWQISEDPARWQAPVKAPPEPPAPRLQQAGKADSEVIPEIYTLTSDDPLDPRTLQVMSDGSLAIGVERPAQVDGERQWIAEVWRLQPEEASLSVLWQGLDGADSILLDESADTLWFWGRPLNGGDGTLFRYRGNEKAPQAVTLATPSSLPGPGNVPRWQLDAQGRPRLYSYRVDRIYRYQREEGGRWHYNAVEVPRAALFSQPLRPVRWAGDALWVEDLYGVAELNPANGRVRKVIQAPQRYGVFPHEGPPPSPDLRDHPSSWTAVGSSRGQWVTSGFQLRPAPERERVAGMHVFDTEKGEYLYSAVLDGRDQIRAAAASPDGHWLAMAVANQVQLREARTGRTPVALKVPSGVSVLALAFSPQGRDLYALTMSTVLHWRLPRQR